MIVPLAPYHAKSAQIMKEFRARQAFEHDACMAKIARIVAEARLAIQTACRRPILPPAPVSSTQGEGE